MIELEPGTGRVVWTCRADPPESFFTKRPGSVQALPNGNVLFTESEKGRIFEVTRAGEVVSEFWNPDVDGDGRRLQVYRMIRLDLERLRPLARPDRLEPTAGLSDAGGGAAVP